MTPGPEYKYLIVEIIGFSHDSHPGRATCKFTDVFGSEWIIEEKISIISTGDIPADTVLPVRAYIKGEVVSATGEIACFCTANPWHIQAANGADTFFVHHRQLCDEMPVRV